jgi:hypothetical protein
MKTVQGKGCRHRGEMYWYSSERKNTLYAGSRKLKHLGNTQGRVKSLNA